MNEQGKTIISGHSDDIIMVQGEYRAEMGCYDHKKPIQLVVSDGTKLAIGYGLNEAATWDIEVLAEGSLFSHIEKNEGEDSGEYSDKLHLNEGVEWVAKIINMD